MRCPIAVAILTAFMIMPTLRNVPCSGVCGTNQAQTPQVKTALHDVGLEAVTLRGTTLENVDDSGVEEVIVIVSRSIMVQKAGHALPGREECGTDAKIPSLSHFLSRLTHIGNG